ncbi:MAG TPA: TolC family protein [Polyangiales bacterium]|nr:TolC family protein [Polyangiales bacterium]
MSRSVLRAAPAIGAVLLCWHSASVRAREVSFAELWAYARAHAPPLRVAEARTRLADGQRAAASAWFPENPELELSVGPRFRAGEEGVDFSAALRQPLELNGGRGSRLRAAARASERLGVARELREVEIELALEAAYRNAQLARARLALSTRVAEFSAELRSRVERRLSAGDATLIELRVAEGEAARAASDALVQQNALQTASLALCELSGWPSTDPPLPAAELPALRTAPNLVELSKLAEQRHPELRLHRAELEQARAEAEVAERAVFPRPALGAELSRETGPEGPPAWIVLGTLRVSLPVWQRLEAERGEKNAEQRIALAELEAFRNTTRVRIASALAELSGAAQRLQLLAASGASFDESLGLLQRGLEAGELPLLEVSFARQRLLDAQLAALDARADYERAWIELERAVGARLGGEP